MTATPKIHCQDTARFSKLFKNRFKVTRVPRQPRQAEQGSEITVNWPDITRKQPRSIGGSVPVFSHNHSGTTSAHCRNLSLPLH
jgi:hypothetical protein